MVATFASWSYCLVHSFFFFTISLLKQEDKFIQFKKWEDRRFSRTGDLIIDGKLITSECTFRGRITYTNLVLNEWSSIIWMERMQYDYWQYLANGVYHLKWKVILLTLYKMFILNTRSYLDIFKLSLDKAIWNSLRPKAWDP